MEHVVVRWEPERYGYWLDPTAYLAILPTLAESLPPGAREFALQRGHYDFASDRCVKDLWFQSLTLDDAAGSGSTSLCFSAPYGSESAVVLRLAYSGLSSVAVNRENDSSVGWLGSLLLDEMRPHPGGFVHEIALTTGSMTLVAGDVEATWS